MSRNVNRPNRSSHNHLIGAMRCGFGGNEGPLDKNWHDLIAAVAAQTVYDICISGKAVTLDKKAADLLKKADKELGRLNEKQKRAVESVPFKAWHTQDCLRRTMVAIGLTPEEAEDIVRIKRLRDQGHNAQNEANEIKRNAADAWACIREGDFELMTGMPTDDAIRQLLYGDRQKMAAGAKYILQQRGEVANKSERQRLENHEKYLERKEKRDAERRKIQG